MVLMPLLSRLLTLLVILTMPLFLARLTLIPIKSLSIDRKSGSAGMPRPISYVVFCLKKNINHTVKFSEVRIQHDVMMANDVNFVLIELRCHNRFDKYS